MCARETGEEETKRGGGQLIEMNEPWDKNLKMYSAVDKFDQTLLNYDINYCCWKWWHAPMRHAKTIAMSMVYNIYLQCSEGGVDPNWQGKPFHPHDSNRNFPCRWYSTRLGIKNILAMRKCMEQPKSTNKDEERMRAP